MRTAPLLAFGLLVGGAVLVADAVARGNASIFWVLIFPVLSGNSPEFLVGTLLLIAGIFSVALTAVGPRSTERGGRESAPPDEVTPAGNRFAGVVVVGPVPFFFGGWAGVSRRTRLLVAVAGGVALVGFVLAVWLVSR